MLRTAITLLSAGELQSTPVVWTAILSRHWKDQSKPTWMKSPLQMGQDILKRYTLKLMTACTSTKLPSSPIYLRECCTSESKTTPERWTMSTVCCTIFQTVLLWKRVTLKRCYFEMLVSSSHVSGVEMTNHTQTIRLNTLDCYSWFWNHALVTVITQDP